MFRLEIATDNAAFDDGVHDELARILGKLAKALRDGESLVGGHVTDVNDNIVGQWQYTPED